MNQGKPSGRATTAIDVSSIITPRWNTIQLASVGVIGLTLSILLGTNQAHQAHEILPITADAYTLKVNLNAAGSGELMLLPGVGPSTARDITLNRKYLGRFKKADDLVRVPGIGSRTFKQLEPYVFVQSTSE